MSHILKEKGGLGDSKRQTSNTHLRLSLSTHPPSESLPSPFGDLGINLSDADLRETAYEIFASVTRTAVGKPLTYIPNHSSAERSPSPVPSMQRLLTSTAAGKMKKALGLKPSKKSPGREKAGKRPGTVGELVRVQMGVSEQADSRIRRGLLRISASQV